MIEALAEERQVHRCRPSPRCLSTRSTWTRSLFPDLKEGRTEFRKLAPEDYWVWLDEGFASGELWQK